MSKISRLLFAGAMAVPGLLVLSLLAGVPAASAAVISVDWDSGTSGDLDGTAVTMSSVASPAIFTADLTGADYSAAPLSATTESASYDALSDWTVTFSDPIADLLLYAVFWRGVAGGSSSPITYTFDQSFTVLSGLGGAVVSSNMLSVPNTGFHNGILHFAGPVSSLSLRTNSDSFSNQAVTFAVEADEAVPEPGAIGLLGLGAFGLWAMVRRRRNAA